MIARRRSPPCLDTWCRNGRYDAAARPRPVVGCMVISNPDKLTPWRAWNPQYDVNADMRIERGATRAHRYRLNPLASESLRQRLGGLGVIIHNQSPHLTSSADMRERAPESLNARTAVMRSQTCYRPNQSRPHTQAEGPHPGPDTSLARPLGASDPDHAAIPKPGAAVRLFLTCPPTWSRTFRGQASFSAGKTPRLACGFHSHHWFDSPTKASGKTCHDPPSRSLCRHSGMRR